MKFRMISPTWSLPVSLMKLTGIPVRPNEMMPLKVEPPGTLAVGWLFWKMMSNMVSPSPMILRMVQMSFVNDSSFVSSTFWSSDNGIEYHVKHSRNYRLNFCNS